MPICNYPQAGVKLTNVEHFGGEDIWNEFTRFRIKVGKLKIACPFPSDLII